MVVDVKLNHQVELSADEVKYLLRFEQGVEIRGEACPCYSYVVNSRQFNLVEPNPFIMVDMINRGLITVETTKTVLDTFECAYTATLIGYYVIDYLRSFLYSPDKRNNGYIYTSYSDKCVPKGTFISYVTPGGEHKNEFIGENGLSTSIGFYSFYVPIMGRCYCTASPDFILNTPENMDKLMNGELKGQALYDLQYEAKKKIDKLRKNLK